MSMCYTPLPQELLECITVYLKNDRRALRAFSLVSQAFRSPSQRHIFSSIEITVTNEDRNHELYDILSLHPEIALHVRKLKLLLIADNEIGVLGDVTVVEEDALITTLRMLSCLQSLDFGSYWFGTAQWKNYSVALRSSILDLLRLPNLDHVVASQITDFPCASAFEGCTLKTLELYYLNTSMDFGLTIQNLDIIQQTQTEQRHIKPWKVETLAIDSIPNMVVPILSSLFPFGMIVASLTTLEISEVGSDDGVDLCQSLLDCSSTLENLKLRIVEPCMTPWPKAIRLRSLPFLRSLYLHVAGKPHHSLSWIYETLTDVQPVNDVETITLVLGDMIHLTTLREEVWRMIDSLIQNWDAPRLKLVDISFHALEIEPDFSKFLLTKVPNLFLRQIVTLNNNDAQVYPHEQS